VCTKKINICAEKIFFGFVLMKIMVVTRVVTKVVTNIVMITRTRYVVKMFTNRIYWLGCRKIKDRIRLGIVIPVMR
jgi:hypothetical protein